MAFPFLSLPLELQRDTIGHLINHADLRALCLISKHIEAIAAPLLFHDIALNQYRGCTSCSFGHCKLIPLGRQTPMVKAISKSKNLCYVRTLSTPMLEDQDAIRNGDATIQTTTKFTEKIRLLTCAYEISKHRSSKKDTESNSSKPPQRSSLQTEITQSYITV